MQISFIPRIPLCDSSNPLQSILSPTSWIDSSVIIIIIIIILPDYFAFWSLYFQLFVNILSFFNIAKISGTRNPPPQEKRLLKLLQVLTDLKKKYGNDEIF